MAATLKLNYTQVRNLATQLSMKDIGRLSRELASIYDEARENSRPYTIEEVRTFAAEAEADIKAGRVCTAEEGWSKLESKFPWLKD